MREFVSPETGEIFAQISLATWLRIVRRAVQVDTDNGGSCHCQACSLAAEITIEHDGRATLEAHDLAGLGGQSPPFRVAALDAKLAALASPVKLIDDRGVRGAEVDMEWDESDVEHGGEGG